MSAHPSLRKQCCCALAALLLAPAAARAWESHVDRKPGSQGKAWTGDWDDEHRQIAYAALQAINATAYADQAHAPPPTGSGPYLGHRTGNAAGICQVTGEHRPGMVGKTPGGGFCILDLNSWIARMRADDPLAAAYLDRVTDQSTGDDPNTVLQERYLPEADHFAELPDSEYSVVDYILKDSYCPPATDVVDQYSGLSSNPAAGLLGTRGCHSFSLWLGAATNSTHFGSEAVLHWQRYHRIALALATRASALRALLQSSLDSRQGNLDSRPELLEVVEEAEREALAYEGAAQHFLQDRWSSGHMWNRLGGPDPRQLDLSLSFPGIGSVTIPGFTRSLVAGLYSGLLHGAQAVAGAPLPSVSPGMVLRYSSRGSAQQRLLSFGEILAHQNLGGTRYDPFAPCPFFSVFSPACGGTIAGIVPAEFANPAGAGVLSAVGDFRFLDLLAGGWVPNEFEFRTPASPALPGGGRFFPFVNGSVQQRFLLDCTARSYAEVIRAFGANGSGFGSKQVSLPGNLGGPVEGDPLCSGMWLTNASFGRALDALRLVDLGEAARSELLFGSAAGAPLSLGAVAGAGMTLAFRAALTAALAEIRIQARRDPNGTTLAQNMPPFLGVGPQPGALPGHIEPEDLDSMPDVDPVQIGRSKRSLFGATNRAHADYWCGQLNNLVPNHADRSPLPGTPTFALAAGDNNLPIQSLRRPAYDAPADDATRRRIDENVEVCKMMASRIFYRSTVQIPACDSTVCGYKIIPLEQFEPLCNDIGHTVILEELNDPSRGFAAAYAPVYVDDSNDLPIPFDTVQLDDKTGYPRTIVNWCESTPAVYSSAVPVANGRRGPRFMVGNFTPAQAQLAENPGWRPAVYLQPGPFATGRSIVITGANFGSSGRLELIGPTSRTWSFDQASGLLTGDRKQDLLSAGVHFKLSHASEDTLDQVEIRLIQLPPGEYQVILHNDSDPAHLQNSGELSNKLLVGCSPIDDFPSLRPANPQVAYLRKSGSDCACNIGKTVKHVDGSDPDGDFWNCDTCEESRQRCIDSGFPPSCCPSC